MQSEGPYTVDFEDGQYFILGFPFSRMLRFMASEQFEVERICYWANKAYAEGRKSMEKDFKELLDLANQFDAEAPYKDPTSFEFGAWKKARGIE